MSRLISLFAGIGGFDLGFERAGFTTVFQCELSKNSRAVLERHWPEVSRHDDIATLAGGAMPDAEVLAFGSPCQDLSVAGNRKGLAGERSGLFFEAVRVIREKRKESRGRYPRFVVWENVVGSFSSNGGRDFAAVLRAMAELGALDIAWRVLDSQHFGVPQRRRRVFLVADFAGERAGEALLEPAGSDGVAAAPLCTWQEHPRVATHRTGGDRGWLTIASPDVAHALLTRNTRQDATAETLVLVATGDGQNADPLTTTEGWTYSHEGTNFRLRKLVADMRAGLRRLTPVECERLQGFPDMWTDGFSDAARYRMLGNAVTVNVAEWIARRMKGLI